MAPRPGDPAAEIVALYERHVRSYDQDRGRALFERPWLDRFDAAMAPGGTVLDLGCGSGAPIARHLIERGLAVTGVDSAPTLVGGPAAGEAIGSYRLYHASLDREEYTMLLAGAGFCILRHVVDDAGCGGHTVWLARFAACADRLDTPPDDHHHEACARQGSGP